MASNKRKTSKEEKEKLIESKRSAFSSLGNECLEEWEHFHHCDNCRWLKEDCHRTCGVIMRWKHKIGDVKTVSCGTGGRITNEMEFLDTSSVNLGLAEEVEKTISREFNGNCGNYITEEYEGDEDNDE